MMINRPEEPKSTLEQIFDFYEKNAKKLNRLFKWTGIILVTLLVSHLCILGYNRYVYNSQLKRTANQIAQLVDNVRTTYAVHTETKTDIMKLMAQSNTMPDFLVKDGKLYNVYGGTIAVSSSLPVEDRAARQMLPTFKIAYQGLKKEVCVALAKLNWGDEKSGLIATAVGYIDGTGIDTALRDVEEEREKSEVEIKTKSGEIKKINRPARILPTVGKPGDQFNPSPFGDMLAQSGCSCGSQRACSFALRYYTYVRKRK
ncbi:MAG: hypothetical protein IJ770_00950 [Alphaproteobacteria bacterium]|nr:hypothetical protein [Alphaproteobacteria bacterium]